MPLLSKVLYSKVYHSFYVTVTFLFIHCSNSDTPQRPRLAAHLKKHHEGKHIKTEPSDQPSPLSPQNIQAPSSILSNTRTSPSLLNEVGTNQSTLGQASPATHLTAQSQIDVSYDVMEISDDSENDENDPTLQARPSANSTYARASHPRVSSSGARARPPAAPSAPDAASSFKPTRQLKSPLPKMRRSDERFLLPEFRYSVMTSASIYEPLKLYLVSLGETEDAQFPWRRVIQDFVHLYFEHFDHEYPRGPPVCSRIRT